MKRLTLTVAVLVALAVPATAGATWLGEPYSGRDASFEAARVWYPNCSWLVEDYPTSGKWRHALDVCINEVVACAPGWAGFYKYVTTGGYYVYYCGHRVRNFDTWCWAGTNRYGSYGQWTRVRDVYHGWEFVGRTGCQIWKP